MLTLALLTLPLLVAAKCGSGLQNSPYAPDKGYTAKIKVKDETRSFNFHLPPTYDGKTSAQVYFSFPGSGKTVNDQESLSGLSTTFFNPKGIAVYYQGKDKHLLSHPGSDADPNDIDFTLEILNWLDKNLCIDKTRIYATGKSNGGGFVNLLACDPRTARKFAAFAAVSGAYYEDKQAQECNPGVPVPFLSFHGTSDTTAPYDGKGPSSDDGDDDDDDDSDDNSDSDDLDKTTYPIVTWLQDWAKRDGLSYANPASSVSVYAGYVQKTVWSRPGYQNLLVHYKESKLGHVWPSTLPNLDCPAPKSPKCPEGHYVYNATSLIVDYFTQWKLNV